MGKKYYNFWKALKTKGKVVNDLIALEKESIMMIDKRSS